MVIVPEDMSLDVNSQKLIWDFNKAMFGFEYGGRGRLQARTHTHTHAHPYARTPTCTHTHTNPHTHLHPMGPVLILVHYERKSVE